MCLDKGEYDLLWKKQFFTLTLRDLRRNNKQKRRSQTNFANFVVVACPYDIVNAIR